MWKLFQGEKYLREEALIMQVVHNDWFVQFEFKMCQIGLMVSCKKMPFLVQLEKCLALLIS